MARKAFSLSESTSKAGAKKALRKGALLESEESDVKEEGDDAEAVVSMTQDFSHIPHQVKTLDVSTLMHQISNKQLVLRPEYQREEDVWPLMKKSRLIESLLMGVVIPNIYVANTEEDSEVMDGLQRLSTIRQFTQGEFAISGKSPIAEKGKKFSELPKALQNRIMKAPLIVIEVGSNQHPITNELKFETFVRLQGGSPLNAIEIIHASFQGPLMKAAKKLASDERFENFFAPKKKRMKNLEAALSAMVYAFEGEFSEDQNIFDDIRALCRKYGGIGKSKEIKDGIDQIYAALDLCIEAFPAEEDNTYFAKLKAGHRQAYAMVAFGVVIDVIADDNPGKVNTTKLQRALERSINSEKQLTFSTGGASSYDKYQAITKLIRKLDAREEDAPVPGAKKKAQDITYDHSESDAEA